jgi:hypothetical protein
MIKNALKNNLKFLVLDFGRKDDIIFKYVIKPIKPDCRYYWEKATPKNKKLNSVLLKIEEVDLLLVIDEYGKTSFLDYLPSDLISHPWLSFDSYERRFAVFGYSEEGIEFLRKYID